MGIRAWFGFGSKPDPTELLIRASTLLIVKEVRKMEAKLMATLDDVIAKVAEQSSVVASAAALIDGLQDQLVAALKEGADPEKIKAIIDGIESDKAKLVEAMKENTIAEVEPVPMTEAGDQPPEEEFEPVEPDDEWVPPKS